MGSRRSERSHKVVNYAKLVGSEDDCEDFADFCDNKAPKKRARLEEEALEKNTKLLEESKKVVTPEDVHSSQKKRISLDERIFERHVNQAITASKGNIVEHIVFNKSKPNNKDKKDIASDSYENTDDEEEEDDYSSVSSSDYEGDNNDEEDDDDFKPKSSSQGKLNQKTKTTTKDMKKAAKLKTKQLSVVVVDIKKKEVQAPKSTAPAKDFVLGKSVASITVETLHIPDMKQTKEDCLSLDVKRKPKLSLEDEKKHNLSLDIEKKHNLSLQVEQKHNPEDKQNTIKDDENQVSAEQNTDSLLKISPIETSFGSEISEAKTEHDGLKIIAKDTTNCESNIEGGKKYEELKLSSLKPKIIPKKENSNSLKISSSITNMKLMDSKENSPAITSYTSPLNISPKGIRIGLSRKVIKSLHPGIRKPS